MDVNNFYLEPKIINIKFKKGDMYAVERSIGI